MVGFIFGGGAGGDIDVTATGTTTPRSLPDRFAEVFNVCDFGAVADSNANASTGTDQSASIQAAIDAASAVHGGTIYFPPGDLFAYRVDEPLTFDSDLCGYFFLGAGTAALSSGVVGGSAVVGNFDGYIFDRNNINSSGALVRFSNLGIRNIGGSAIRMIGTGGACGVDYCSIQAANYGIQLGGVGSPASATFTANSSGTALTVSGITGTIDSATFPCPIGETSGVPAATTITAQVSGTPGGNGVYTTNQATTCSGSTVTTHPNAPSAFCTEVSNCLINGTGTYNVDPASSFTGVGIQMSPETMVRGCHINAFGVAVRGYGQGNWIYGCQMESNTTGIRLGSDGAGNNSAAIGCIISGCSMESNVTGIQLFGSNFTVIEGTYITGAVDASHNSTYGVLIDGTQGLTMDQVGCNGDFNTAGFYLGGAAGAIRRVIARGCDGSLDKDGSVNYSCMTAVQCKNFGTLSSTLAQLNTMAAAGDINVGERRLMSDSTVAPASQVYNATTVGTGTGSNLASVWWDGTIFRYG